jgi:hypothetical protein
MVQTDAHQTASSVIGPRTGTQRKRQQKKGMKNDSKTKKNDSPKETGHCDPISTVE